VQCPDAHHLILHAPPYILIALAHSAAAHGGNVPRTFRDAARNKGWGQLAFSQSRRMCDWALKTLRKLYPKECRYDKGVVQYLQKVKKDELDALERRMIRTTT